MIQEFLIIFIINYIGIILTEVFNLPIPGTINGMLLLFALLYFKVLKLEKIERAGDFFAAEYDNIFYASFCKID